MQTVFDVLASQGRSALLSDAIISTILSQLNVTISYEPMRCQTVSRDLMRDMADEKKAQNCIVVGNTVTGICTVNTESEYATVYRPRSENRSNSRQSHVNLRNSHGLDNFLSCDFILYEKSLRRRKTLSWRIGRE
ncbi:hypothetical protein KIN20_013313 [Parelaphostrongylus tenuis]|uniref:Uncharacterized protein n=1 Tax=Parelaphostrongylus tenuis TaxID=148309 RepID=A0AAD5MBX1_PARTN|nr:hypothetical protein KIN20_013313 [Parelaphostrongylus tenuis]